MLQALGPFAKGAAGSSCGQTEGETSRARVVESIQTFPGTSRRREKQAENRTMIPFFLIVFVFPPVASMAKPSRE